MKNKKDFYWFWKWNEREMIEWWLLLEMLQIGVFRLQELQNMCKKGQLFLAPSQEIPLGALFTIYATIFASLVQTRVASPNAS